MAVEVISDSDILRVQAMALAAQQSALTEQEIRLRERMQEWNERERQLAAHLDEKFRQLTELQNQVNAHRDAQRTERVALHSLRTETVAAHAEAIAERDRLKHLRSRLIKRWKAQWSRERLSVETQRADLACRSSQLETERETFDRLQREFHGDAELEKRRLRDERQNLEHERTQFQRDQRLFQADVITWETQIDERIKSVTAAETKLAHDRQNHERNLAIQQAEVKGLENRIANLRNVVIQLERKRAGAEVSTLPKLSVHPVPLPEPWTPSLTTDEQVDSQRKQRALLEKQAAALSDQRVHLAELFLRLARAESDWQGQQAATIWELQGVTANLQQQDEVVRGRTRDVQIDADRLGREQEAIAHLRRELERGNADLATRQAAWTGERNCQLADLHGQMRLVERRERAISALFRRWRDRRSAEIAQFRSELQVMLKQRAEWIAERDEWRHRSDSMRQGMQAVAEQSLVLEEARQEFLNATDHPKAAARRLERLRRRRDRLWSRAGRDLERQRLELSASENSFEFAVREHQNWFEKMLERQRELTANLEEAEFQRTKYENEVERLESERNTWREQRRHYERQIAQLKDEIERVASIMISDGPDQVSSAA